MCTIENGVAKCDCGREFYRMEETIPGRVGMMCIKGAMSLNEEMVKIIDKFVDEIEEANSICFHMHGREMEIETEIYKDVEYVIQTLKKFLGED